MNTISQQKSVCRCGFSAIVEINEKKLPTANGTDRAGLAKEGEQQTGRKGWKAAAESEREWDTPSQEG